MINFLINPSPAKKSYPENAIFLLRQLHIDKSMNPYHVWVNIVHTVCNIGYADGRADGNIVANGSKSV